MIFRTLVLIIFTVSLSSSVIPEYKAKYKFERDDFSITGIRELKKSNNDDLIFALKEISLFTCNEKIIKIQTKIEEIETKHFR